MEWFNGNSGAVNQEKATNSYLNDTFYTVPELGKIEVVTIDNDNGSYTFTSKELDYASDTEIANCTVPIEVLVDFLNISASTEFLSAFEELIKDQEVIIKLYDLTTTQTVETHTEQEANPSANITANIVYEMDEGVAGPPPREQITQTENFDSVTISKNRTSTHINIDYELALEKASTWYVKMERTLNRTASTRVDGPNESTIPGYTIQGIGDSAFHDSRIDSNTQEILSGNLDFDSLWRRIENRIPSRSGCHVVPGESSVTINSTTVEVQDGTRTVTTTTTTQILIRGTMQYDDNTDAFLGLWKNEDGQYHSYTDYDPDTGEITYNNKALFDPDGKKVGYHDLYGDDDAYIGELFVNADEELFELLESSASSERTESYANIMRYILYRYTNKDYGITTFSQLLRLLGLNVRSTGRDFNVNTSTADGAEIMPTREELRAALQSTPYWSVFEGDMDAIYNAQETYHVNGIFTAAVAIIESSAGTDMSGRYGARRL